MPTVLSLPTQRLKSTKPKHNVEHAYAIPRHGSACSHWVIMTSHSQSKFNDLKITLNLGTLMHSLNYLHNELSIPRQLSPAFHCIGNGT
ncbi:hypothetical protein VYA_01290 [Vibrio alfacsensis]|nr:hypothetical protein VA249_25880 [Vibrio alfacsensis]BCN22937.1 hypothetical protein VYA_01290 [Vibrio alfacsensis]